MWAALIPPTETAINYEHFCNSATIKKKNIKLEDIMLLTAEPTVPARGRCHTAQCTTVAGLVKSKAEPDYDQSVWPELRTFTEHRVFGAKGPKRVVCGLLLTGTLSWTAWPRMKSSSQLSHFVLAGTWRACFTWIVTIQSASLFSWE